MKTIRFIMTLCIICTVILLTTSCDTVEKPTSAKTQEKRIEPIEQPHITQPEQPTQSSPEKPQSAPIKAPVNPPVIVPPTTPVIVPPTDETKDLPEIYQEPKNIYWLNHTLYTENNEVLLSDCDYLSDRYYYKNNSIYDIKTGLTIDTNGVAYFDGEALYETSYRYYNDVKLDGFVVTKNGIPVDNTPCYGTPQSMYMFIVITTNGGMYDITRKRINIKRITPHAIVYNAVDWQTCLYIDGKDYTVSGQYFSAGYDYFIFDGIIYSGNGCEAKIGTPTISKDNCNVLYRFYAENLGQAWDMNNVLKFIKIDADYFYFAQYNCGHIIKLNRKTGAYESIKKLYTPVLSDTGSAVKYRDAVRL